MKNILSEHIETDRIHLKHAHGGFVIDIMITGKTKTSKNIAIDCDGGVYNGSEEEAYMNLLYKKRQLEGFGFKYIHIWPWEFGVNPEEAIKELLDQIS